ncbi:response regulator [Paenibacillus sp. R14(2021)]|uniref:response regulator transcription factor n=1 Tax=Paenibacillus sp. R14(2021) TaxID=2859228 RepID=UPI001C611D25|nr:response regulator [Paenibacillus sp. R14(2021)]
MVKLMVVDDELWIREGLKQTIDWAAHGIEFIGDAEDGLQALELLESNVPDIMITDIKMPSMDGMELMEEMKRRGIVTKVIFISGFNDFVYAQKAVKLGAFDYILKPIEENVLLEIIDRCVAEIKQKRKLFSRMEELSGLVRESIPLAKQKQLEICLSRPIAGQELRAKWEALGIDLNPERLVVLSAVVHDWGERALNESGCSLMRYALGNLMAEMLAEEGVRSLACPLHENDFADVALIASLEDGTASAGQDDVCRGADRMIKRALQILGLRISIGVSGTGEGKKLFFAFREALTYSVDYFVRGAGLVHGTAAGCTPSSGVREGHATAPAHRTGGSGDMHEALAGEVPYITIQTEALDTAWSNRMLHAMKQMDESRLSELLDEQLKLLQETVKQGSAFAVRCEMNLYIDMLLAKWQELCRGKDRAKPREITHQMKLQLYRCPLPDWKQTVMNAFLKKDSGAAGFGQKRTIEHALRYIHDNFHLGISLHNVAETIYLNPSYFSRMFHEEVGETLSRYLIRIRISKAKELLEQTPLKIYEIADRVGYKDFRHFVKTFKEWEGMTPAQFRNYGA